MARRKTPMTRAELSEKIGYLTSAFGADAYAAGYNEGIVRACDVVQNWVEMLHFPMLSSRDLIKKLGDLRKKKGRE